MSEQFLYKFALLICAYVGI